MGTYRTPGPTITPISEGIYVYRWPEGRIIQIFHNKAASGGGVWKLKISNPDSSRGAIEQSMEFSCNIM